jgi:Holliday junction resolvase RusA-like endonuclease
MPPQHKAWEDAAVQQLREQRTGDESWTGFIVVGIDAWMPRPASRPAWFPKDAWKAGKAYATPTKPDADNIAKITLDAMVKAGILEDDRFVCELHVHRYMHARGATPGLTITVENWTPLDSFV